MKIKELMLADVEVVDHDASIYEAAYLMGSAGVGMLPVLDEEKLVGVITDRDIIVRAVAEGLDSVSTTVRDMMTPEPISCREDDDVAEAERLMSEHQLRRIVVVDGDGLLAGILAADDLAFLPAVHQDDAPGERR
jgi:CBS domain-containing protein